MSDLVQRRLWVKGRPSSRWCKVRPGLLARGRAFGRAMPRPPAATSGTAPQVLSLLPRLPPGFFLAALSEPVQQVLNLLLLIVGGIERQRFFHFLLGLRLIASLRHRQPQVIVECRPTGVFRHEILEN